MLVVGWADGYRNNSFRVVEQYERHGVPWRMLAGPWVHKSPERARPAPNVDDDVEILSFFDEHLRGGPCHTSAPAQVYVREHAPPEPDLAFHPGRWVDVDRWPMPGGRRLVLQPDSAAVRQHVVRGDVGWSAWNSCAGGLPWGQPLDQAADNARSICFEWPVDAPVDVLGNAVVRLRVSSDQPYGHVSVKLCSVTPTGESTLVARGYLDLRHRGCWPADESGEVGRAPADLEPGAWIDVAIGVEATAWRFTPGTVVRLAIAGTDWPNCWPAPGPLTLSVDAASVVEMLAAAVPVWEATARPIPRVAKTPTLATAAPTRDRAAG